MGREGWKDLQSRRVDGAVVVALAVAAVVVRWDATPRDGLWHDDTWVVAGARTGLDDLLLVSTNHPGFTLPFAVWHHLGTMATDHVALPVLAVGVLTPPVLHLLLRRLGVGTLVAAGTAALLVASEVHITYSGRVKPYVVEALVVVAMAAVVHAIGRRTWTGRTAIVWVGGAVALGTLSAFTVVITAVAITVLAATAGADRRVRLGALAAQGLVQGAIGLFLRSRYDASAVAEDWETTYDGYIELTANPLRLVGDVVTHLGRVGGALVDHGGAVGVGVVALAVAGLVMAMRPTDQRPVAAFLLGLLVVALVGGLARQIPFGPTIANAAFPGSRATIWLLPSLVVGLALVLDAATRRLPPVPARVLGAATLAVGVLLVGIQVEDRPIHAELGTQTAVDLIHEQRAPDDVVIVFSAGAYAHASEPGTPVAAELDRQDLVGYRIRFVDSGTVVLPDGWRGGTAVVDRLVGDAPTVFVHDTFVGYVDRQLPDLEAALDTLGYRQAASTATGITMVQRWERSPGG